MGAPLLSLEVPATENAPGVIREAVAAMDPGLGDDREDTLLLVSELVTNSVRHARVGARDAVSVTVEPRGERLHVEVADPGDGFEAGVPAPAADEPDGYAGGWGLRLVEMLAEDWGVEHGEGGVRVWFEMRCLPTPSGAVRPRS